MNKKQKYPMGAIPDRADAKDYTLDMLVAKTPIVQTFPEIYSLRDNVLRIKNQGVVGSCVGQGLGAYKTHIETEQHDYPILFSAEFIYSNRLDTDHQGEGMFTRQALMRLLEDGALPENLWPEKAKYIQYPAIKEFLEDWMYEEAKPYRISAFARIYAEAEIKKALIELGPVPITVAVKDPQYQWIDENNIFSTNLDKISGYHLMLIIGYDDNKGWEIQNSWGKRWGDNGFAWMPFDYPLVSAWALTDNILPDLDDDIDPDERMVIKLFIDNTNAYVNNRKIELDVAPEIKNSRTFIPLRFVAENLGVKVDWLHETKEIILQKMEETDNIKLQIDNTKVYINNELHAELRAAPYIKNNRTMVPIRVVAEFLGFQVDWISETKSVEIRE